MQEVKRDVAQQALHADSCCGVHVVPLQGGASSTSDATPRSLGEAPAPAIHGTLTGTLQCAFLVLQSSTFADTLCCFHDSSAQQAHGVALQMSKLKYCGSEEDVVTVVNTARQLLDVVAAGCGHVEVQSHLDLTAMNLPEQFYSEAFSMLGAVPPSVKSITVCT